MRCMHCVCITQYYVVRRNWNITTRFWLKRVLLLVHANAHVKCMHMQFITVVCVLFALCVYVYECVYARMEIRYPNIQEFISDYNANWCQWITWNVHVRTTKLSCWETKSGEHREIDEESVCVCVTERKSERKSGKEIGRGDNNIDMMKSKLLQIVLKYPQLKLFIPKLNGILHVANTVEKKKNERCKQKLNKTTFFLSFSVRSFNLVCSLFHPYFSLALFPPLSLFPPSLFPFCLSFFHTASNSVSQCYHASLLIL